MATDRPSSFAVGKWIRSSPRIPDVPSSTRVALPPPGRCIVPRHWYLAGVVKHYQGFFRYADSIAALFCRCAATPISANIGDMNAPTESALRPVQPAITPALNVDTRSAHWPCTFKKSIDGPLVVFCLCFFSISLVAPQDGANKRA